MDLKRWLAVVGACLIALSAVSDTWAAGTRVSVIKQQKVVAGYSLVLQLGPTQTMSDMASKTGAMTVGGKSATCRMPANAMVRHGAKCNYHISVLVKNASTNKIVLNAHVAITMRNLRKHTSVSVPIMMMVGAGGLRDFQYGNNITVAAGSYAVVVTVNGAHANFAVSVK